MTDAEREVERLRDAIRKHRDQRGDDRCWLDDLELYATLPEGFNVDLSTIALPPRDAFLANCARYHAARHPPGEAPSDAPEGRWATAEEVQLLELRKRGVRE